MKCEVKNLKIKLMVYHNSTRAYYLIVCIHIYVYFVKNNSAIAKKTGNSVRKFVANSIVKKVVW